MRRPWAFYLLLAVLVASAAWTRAGEPPAKPAEPPAKAAEAPWPLWDGKETVAEYAKRAGLDPTRTLKLNDKVSLELVLIPAGKFLMGSPETERDRQPNEVQHEVTISRPFYMGKYEVTQEQYEAVMEKNPSHFKGAKNPVEQVSWDDAQAFCEKVNQRRLVCFGGAQGAAAAQAAQIKALIGDLDNEDPRVREKAQTELCQAGRTALPLLRELLRSADLAETTRASADAILARICGSVRLPSEAQWEYACRAGTTTRFHSGDAAEDLKAAGWHSANSERQTHPVGEKKPNGWGLYDMHGNVWEWCQDFFAEKYEAGAVVDPQGPANGNTRVVRGGSWSFNPGNCRSASRRGNNPDGRGSRNGFRLALNLQ